MIKYIFIVLLGLIFSYSAFGKDLTSDYNRGAIKELREKVRELSKLSHSHGETVIGSASKSRLGQQWGPAEKESCRKNPQQAFCPQSYRDPGPGGDSDDRQEESCDVNPGQEFCQPSDIGDPLSKGVR